MKLRQIFIRYVFALKASKDSAYHQGNINLALLLKIKTSKGNSIALVDCECK
jgi:hypothetical protein